jgi:hypothetical protein
MAQQPSQKLSKPPMTILYRRDGIKRWTYRGGAGYEVEFEKPFHCVVTVGRDDIRPA